MCQVTNLIFFLSLCIYFERGREEERGQGRGQENIHAVSAEPDAGLKIKNCEIVAWVETESDAYLAEPPEHLY